MVWSVERSTARPFLNRIYQSLNPPQQEFFHREFAKLFRDRQAHGRDGVWHLSFLGRSVLAPLTMERLWLDWDTAVSILGHDGDIKETYRALLTAPQPPDLFVDIGANYGTHSLLFLVHGVETLTFEPNPACHDYFREVCALNQVTPSLFPLALGAEAGVIELCFPDQETWLGTTHPQTIQDLQQQESFRSSLKTVAVEQQTLDGYRSYFVHKRVLVKIDTEGNELAVLQGASTVLREFTPKILFEAWPGEARAGLWDFFQAYGYTVHGLPWSPQQPLSPLGREEFLRRSQTNFLAVSVLEGR